MVPTSSTTSSALDDVEFLARSDHRVTALDALAERPRSRADLRTITEASPSTVGRMLREFEERRWVRRSGREYEATQLGAFIASGLRELIERIETERRLRDVWQWLPAEVTGFLLETGSTAHVTVAEVDDPYRPVNRFVSLLRETNRLRFAGPDLALLEPCRDELRRRILGGTRVEIVDPPRVAGHILSTYREHCADSLASGNLTVRIHDNLPPYGVCLFDDRVAISCYDQDSGTVRALIDTDSPVVRKWAESTFESYRREARPLDLETTQE